MTSGRPIAAVDCGSNTTRLLVSQDGRDLVRTSQITGLGRGLAKTGRMSDEAIERCVAVLGHYRGLIDQHGVASRDIGVIATSASRDAANAAQFFDAADAALGVRPTVITGEREASLSFAGAAGGLDGGGSVTVFDIGGGSTEFSVGKVVEGVATLEGAVSIDMGSVRFTDAYVEHDPPRPEELSAMLSVIEAHLDDVVRDLPAAAGASRFVGVAGTATTIAAVEIGMVDYDPDVIDGFVLTRAAAEDVFRTLATEPLADRIHNPGLLEARADVIVAGCAIFVGIMRFFGLDEVIVREHDILDGLIAAVEAGESADGSTHGR
ncbi:MAG: hypothetical protein R2770_08865 [Acidimicrobiales bacterium]|nr:hypothetical protein [Acidimicrobiales bacterium]